MTSAELLLDAFGRIRATVHQAVERLTVEQLCVRLDDDANSIAWLTWHLTRVQDDHLAEIMEDEQVWNADRFFERFHLPFDRAATGYGHSSADVGLVLVEGRLLTDYHDLVHERSCAYIEKLTDPDLERIVDQSFTPPVSLGVRLVSVINDSLQHAGQAAYVRGVVERR